MPDAELSVRSLVSEEERRGAVALQEATWGPGFSQRVPESVLWFVPRIGGVVGGAFGGEGELLGFVFGVTGWVDGAPLHWSDMLAVRRDARGRGIGLALKRWQRSVLLEAEVTRMRWTFDPLEAGNAWLNFARLGCTAGSYLRDVYGTSDSPLHVGLGTDRLVAEWALDDDRVAALARDEDVPPAAGALEVEVPPAIQRLKDEDPEAARAWRARTRAAFEDAFARGYRAVGFRRGPDGGGSYLLDR